jgi:hypothetical protein
MKQKFYLFLSFYLTIIFMPNLLYAQDDKQRVAVLMLLNQAGLKPQEVDYLTSVVRQHIADQMGNQYLIMTQENILTLLPPDKKLEDCLQECEVEIGRNLGAGIIVTGSIVEFNKSYRLNIKVHETKNASLISSKIAKGDDLGAVEQSIAITVKELVNDLKQKDKPKAIEPTIQIADQSKAKLNQIITPKPSNYQAWLIGAGFGTQYSGLGIQAGFQFRNLKLLLGYGLLQKDTSASLPSISLQNYILSISPYHRLALGINYISYEVPNATPYHISIYGADLMYFYDVGDIEGFKLVFGGSLEKRSSDQKKFDRVVPLFLVGMSYSLGE